MRGTIGVAKAIDRAPAQHPQCRDLRELAANLVGDALREVALRAVLRQVAERPHGDDRRRCGGRGGPRRSHIQPPPAIAARRTAAAPICPARDSRGRAGAGRVGGPTVTSLQVAREVARGFVAVRGTLLEAAVDDACEMRRDVAVQCVDRLRFGLDRGRHGLGRRGPGERPASGDGFIGDESQRELIRPVIGIPSARLFGRHVADRAEHDARGRARGQRHGLRPFGPVGPFQLGEPEVDDLHVIGVAHHDVLGLEIAMHDACGMRLRETLGNLVGDAGERVVAATGRPPAGRAGSCPLPIP